MTDDPTWYRIKLTNAADQPKTADVDIFDAIGWYGVDAGQLARDLRGLDAEQITVNINSPGGDVFDGITILNALRQHPARVVANVMGLAASAASFIACGCDEVVMAQNSTLMIHDASGVVIGNAQDMAEMAAILNQISDNIASIYAAKAGGTTENWRTTMKGEKWYSAQEAVDAGLADRLSAKQAEPAPPSEQAQAIRPRAHTTAEARAALALIVQPSMRATGTEPAALPDGTLHRKDTGMTSGTFLADLRARLGITDATADEVQIIAALDETLAEQAITPTAALPEGVVAIERGVLNQLQADASAGREARDLLDKQRRDRMVTDALEAGRITAAQRQQWRDALDQNEETTAALLGSMAAGTVPVTAKAVTTTNPEDVHEDTLYNRAWGSAPRAEGN